jgi:hypothetical protein
MDKNDVPLDLKKYYYKIINKFDNKYIFNNNDEVLALLINCLNYNSPYLILKNIEQIKNILASNTEWPTTWNFQAFLNTLFVRFDNIYSIQIILLFYNDKNLNNYYYSHANKLYDKYKISLKLDYDESSLYENFNYHTLLSNLETKLQDERLFYFQFYVPDIKLN